MAKVREQLGEAESRGDTGIACRPQVVLTAENRSTREVSAGKKMSIELFISLFTVCYSNLILISSRDSTGFLLLRLLQLKSMKELSLKR